ncbi:fatty acid-binding protein, intestinal-like [Syngnathoides biaculeatus]|uniref:fatty acid-binding protein, intestinal-like n=1 Tax=Syngnathoides biaculeatus TaxID=300417 RepID=UPI002ADE9331|nr:fatty acid-binding protein, intestinal-like [Syngnathoides biaculeatus]
MEAGGQQREYIKRRSPRIPDPTVLLPVRSPGPAPPRPVARTAAMAFDGTWKVERSENYDHFMEQMGINVMKRKLAEHDNLKISIQQSGDDFQIKESSTFRTKDVHFTLGTPFDYSLADGTEVSGTWEMEGDALKGKFTRKDNNKVLTTTRILLGDELVQSYSYEGVDAKRIFKKQ